MRDITNLTLEIVEETLQIIRLVRKDLECKCAEMPKVNPGPVKEEDPWMTVNEFLYKNDFLSFSKSSRTKLGLRTRKLMLSKGLAPKKHNKSNKYPESVINEALVSG